MPWKDSRNWPAICSPSRPMADMMNTSWEKDRRAAARALDEARSMSVFCRFHPLAVLRPTLAAQGLVTAGSLRDTPTGTTIQAAGLTIIVHAPPTRSGRRVMFVTLEDETGLMDAVVFEDLQERAAGTIMTSQVLAFEGTLQREGFAGRSISIMVLKIIPLWTGRLADLLGREANGRSRPDEL